MIQHLKSMTLTQRIQMFGFFLMFVGLTILNKNSFAHDPAEYVAGFQRSIKVVGPIFSGVLLLPIGFSAYMVYGCLCGLRSGRSETDFRGGLQTYGTLGGVLLVFAILGILPLFLMA